MDEQADDVVIPRPYPKWLLDLVREFSPRRVPLDVTPEGTYEEATTRWGINPVLAAVPHELREAAERTARLGTHQDSNGCWRKPSRFGFNAFTTADEAEKSIRAYKRTGVYYVWQLPDGLFDATVIPDPKSPWFVDAAVVREVHV